MYDSPPQFSAVVAQRNTSPSRAAVVPNFAKAVAIGVEEEISSRWVDRMFYDREDDAALTYTFTSSDSALAVRVEGVGDSATAYMLASRSAPPPMVTLTAIDPDSATASRSWRVTIRRPPDTPTTSTPVPPTTPPVSPPIPPIAPPPPPPPPPPLPPVFEFCTSDTCTPPGTPSISLDSTYRTVHPNSHNEHVVLYYTVGYSDDHGIGVNGSHDESRGYFEITRCPLKDDGNGNLVIHHSCRSFSAMDLYDYLGIPQDRTIFVEFFSDDEVTIAQDITVSVWQENENKINESTGGFHVGGAASFTTRVEKSR